MEYEGLDLKTNDNVYEPAEDSFLAAEVVSDEIDKLGGQLGVLDMGCGCGIVGLLAGAKENVRSVTFADTSQEAVELARTNADRNRDIVHADCDFVKSDLFSSIDGRFDIIIFNAPYLAEGKGDKMSNAWYGGEHGVEVATAFLKQAVEHMNDHAEIVLIVSSLGDMQRLEEQMAPLGLAIDREQKTHVNFEDIVALVISKHYIMDIS